MTIQEKVSQDLNTALKTGDKSRLKILRYLLSQIKYAEIDAPKGSFNDEQVRDVIVSQVKKVKESREMFAKAGRNEMVEEADLELKVLTDYLPAQLPESELEEKVCQIIKNAPPGLSGGALIGYCIKQLAGTADNAHIAQIIQKISR